MNKTSISSVVCLDIIDFSKKSAAEQQEAKKQLDARVNHAVLDIPEKDRVVVDTDQGVIISCSGPLESALEDALFIALTIRDEILNKNVDSKTPLYLLMAINLGSVSLGKSTKAEEPPKVQGEGLLETQQIMSFGNPNQILVSRAYYDMASKLTLEVAQMFEKYDMHAYEYDIYAVRRLNEKSVVENAAAALDHLEKPVEEPVATSTLDKRIYFLPALLALIMLFVLLKWMNPDEARNVDKRPNMESEMPDVTTNYSVDVLPDPLPEILPEPEQGESIPQQKMSQDKASVVKKKAVKKVEQKPKAEIEKEEKQPVAIDQNVEEPTIEPTAGGSDSNEKSTWDTIKESVKSGSDEQPCSQAQKALNQCK